MSSGIEVTFEYGGLTLTCDDPAFARLCDLIRAEGAVEDLTSHTMAQPDVKVVRVIKASTQSASASPPPGWVSVMMTVLACCLSGAVYITGLTTIIQWLSRWFV